MNVKYSNISSRTDLLFVDTGMTKLWTYHDYENIITEDNTYIVIVSNKPKHFEITTFSSTTKYGK